MRKILFLLIISYVLTTCREKHKEYYDDGSLKYQVDLVNNKREGKALKYYIDGTIMQESNWVDGVKEGPFIIYHQNGNVRLKTEFRLGVENGIRVEYDSLGNLFKRYQVEKSIANGFHQVFNPEGIIILEGDFINDQQDGLWTKYYDDGSLYGSYFLKDGVDIYKKEYEKSGAVLYVKFPIEVARVSNDEFKVKIGIGFTIEPDIYMGALICSEIIDGIPVDTIVRHTSDSLSFLYTPTSSQISDNEICGILFEIERQENNILGACPFVYNIERDSLLYQN